MNWLINSLLTIIASITFSLDIQGNNDHFTYNTEEVNTILAPLNKLELLHNTFPEKPLQDLIKDQDLVDYSFIGSTNPQHEYMDQLPILPAFY